jgi:hypothetical protein
MTDLWYPGGPAPPRLWPLWEAVYERLNSDEMLRLLEPFTGRVFRHFEDESVMAQQPSPWARVVVVPVLGTFEIPDEVGADRVVPWLVRCDVLPRGDRGRFDPLRILEALQAEAWQQLRGWVPGELEHVHVGLPVWRATAPQPVPLWDEGAGTYFTSAQYRAVAEPTTREAYNG